MANTKDQKSNSEKLDDPFKSIANMPTQEEENPTDIKSTWETIPGYALIKRIRQRRLDLDITDGLYVGRKLGLTDSAWRNILNGHRNIASLCNDPAKLKWLSEFLNLPPYAVRVLAGDAQLSDLVVHIDLDDRLREVIGRINKDPKWSVFAHEPISTKWDTLPLETRLLIATLYESKQDTVMDFLHNLEPENQ